MSYTVFQETLSVIVEAVELFAPSHGAVDKVLFEVKVGFHVISATQCV